MMNGSVSTLVALLATGLAVTPLRAQDRAGAETAQVNRAYAGPIIDMHLHAYIDARFARPSPNPATGEPSVRTAAEHTERSIEFMRRYNIVLAAVCTSPDGTAAADAWIAYETDRVLRGVAPDDPTDFMDASSFRDLAEKGAIDVVCEVGAQYEGYSPSDSAFSPYWAIAQERDLPVGIHTGSTFPGIVYRGFPDFRIRFGNPLLLEDMLVQYPDLRVWMMHAGGVGPYAEYALMMLGMYPQLHADIGVLTWLSRPEVLEEFLRKAKQQRKLDRIMFGTDQMGWPEAIGMAVDRINGYDFLTVDEKAGIFYENAARFLELSEDVIARHHEITRTSASR